MIPRLEDLPATTLLQQRERVVLLRQPRVVLEIHLGEVPEPLGELEVHLLVPLRQDLQELLGEHGALVLQGSEEIRQVAGGLLRGVQRVDHVVLASNDSSLSTYTHVLVNIFYIHVK